MRVRAQDDPARPGNRADEIRALLRQLPGMTFVERITGDSIGDGTIPEYVSPQVLDVLGYTQEEFLADPRRRLSAIHPRDHGRVLRALDEAFAAGRLAAQYRMVRKDGRVVWIDEQSILVRDDRGRPTVWQGILQDVTEQKQAELALRAGERRFRAIFDGAAVGIARIALDGWILEANDALAELVGCARLELVGSYLGTFGTTEGEDAVPDEFTALAAGAIDRYEADRAYLAANDAQVWCHVAVSLIRDEEGQPEFAIAMFEDITARRAAEDELARRAMHDALTGLPNRDLLLDRLGVALARAERGGPGIAVMFLDLDGFKRVNDEFGHGTGDAVLIEVASRFRGSLRPSDTLARHGGDEFVVLCEDVRTVQDAVGTADRLARCLREPMTLPNGMAARIGVSIGVTVAHDRSREAERLIRDADTAMYRAKQGGRGGVALSDAEAIVSLEPSI